jgi:UTP--glucose-1-phosphate uridylyltransferase
MIRKAVIPAAGLGTRFLPATKAQPKEMLPVVDKPVIQYVVEEAIASGIKDILIITGKGKRAIEGDAVYYAKSFVGDEAFALLLGDSITVPECTKELIKKYDEFKFKTSIIAVEEVPEEKISSYGIIKGKEVEGDIYLVEDLVEKPSPELTDAVRLVREKRYAYVYRGRRYDIGNKLDWIKSNIELFIRDERFNNEFEMTRLC